MSGTHKEGKRGWRKISYKPEDKKEGNAIAGRHMHGGTEKILRRCRKIWTRLLNKIRRRTDKAIVQEGVVDVGPQDPQDPELRAHLESVSQRWS